MKDSGSTMEVVAFVLRSPVHFVRTFRSRWRELMILGLAAILVHVGFRALSAWMGLQAGDVPNPDWVTDYLGAFSLLTNSGVVGVTAISVLGQLAKAMLILTGLALVAMLTGVLTDGFSASVQQERMAEQADAGARVLREAFEVQPTIGERRLLVQLGLPSLPRRFLPLNTLLTRVGMSLEDMLVVTHAHPEFRIREVREQQKSSATTLVVEWSRFGHDRLYGARSLWKGGPHRIHVVSTQNAGDAYIGHFSACVAEFLGAGYFGNERFSSGAPRRAERLNLSKNDAFRTVPSPEMPADAFHRAAIEQFMNDLKECIEPGDFVLLFSPSREDVATINCATEALSSSNPNEKYDLLRGAASEEAFCNRLRASLDSVPRSSGETPWSCQPASAEYAVKGATDLEQWIYAACGARVMKMHVSMSLLRWGRSTSYFGMVRAIGIAVRSMLDDAHIPC